MQEEHRHHTGTHCLDEQCPSGKRNRYFKGKNMTADDFRLEQSYGIERRRLLNRAVHGWGVVYGFKLEITAEGRLRCEKGLALDTHGRELFRPEDGEIPAHRILLRDFGDHKGQGAFRCLLSAHYAERRVDEVRLGDSCGCGETEWNHVCETVVFALEPHVCPRTEADCPTCSCLPESEMETLAGGRTEIPQSLDRGPHHCLCQWVENKVIGAAPDRLQDCVGFKGFRIAIEDPVPLACVTVRIDDCDHPVFESDAIDPCTPRRLVKTNDLLFDLIRGCDLTRIIHITWAEWHRKLRRPDIMPWETFEKMMVPSPEEEQQAGRRPMFTTGFAIRFSAPVDTVTLTDDSVAMTVFAAEDEGGWIEVRRVPITRLLPTDAGDSVNLCVDAGWVKDEILGTKSIFHRRGVRVEIEVRGDLILDCCGQAVDANAVGFRPVPTGNGTPGGTFISTFRVAPKREARLAAESED